MGPRPSDFDEQLVKQSPTFVKWMQLETGDKLRYACREFVKGHGDDEERLMRRIMIARRNNLRDHDALKRARQQAARGIIKPSSKENADASSSSSGAAADSSASLPRKRRPATLFSDSQISKEMDVTAVEATRSYRAWSELPNGAEFVYNQKYMKGKEGHDWLLRKNIWRRMRYRRENKKMVEGLKEGNVVHVQHVPVHAHHGQQQQGQAASIVDNSLIESSSAGEGEGVALQVVDRSDDKEAVDDLAQDSVSGAGGKDPAKSDEDDFQADDAIEAAVALGVAAAESYAKQGTYNVVHNPLDTGANTAALDAAAKLAAAAATNSMEDSSMAV